MSDIDDFLPQLVTIEEVVAKTRICKATVYNLIKSGELRSVSITRRKLIYVDSVMDLLKRRASTGILVDDG